MWLNEYNYIKEKICIHLMIITESVTLELYIKMNRLYKLNNFDHLVTFARVFRKQRKYFYFSKLILFFAARIQLGYTQHDVGISMGRFFGTFLSQTTVSRFESLNLSVKNMSRLQYLFSAWLQVTIDKSNFWFCSKEILLDCGPPTFE